MSRNLKHIEACHLQLYKTLLCQLKNLLIDRLKLASYMRDHIKRFHDSHQRTNNPGEQNNYEINFASRLCPSPQNFKLTIQHLLALPWSSLLS